MVAADENARDNRDGVVSALIKWVPIEVITFYEGVTTPFGTELHKYLWQAIAIGVAGTFLWIAFSTQNPNALSRIAWRQVVLASFAFVFWVVGTTNPDIWVRKLPWWHSGIGPAALAAGLFILPIIDGLLHRLGVPQD